MSFYQLGRVLVRNGLATVDAAWDLFVTGLSGSFIDGSTVQFVSSGAVGIARNADLTGRLVLEPVSGTPQAGEVCRGAIGASLDGGTADAGSTVTRIEDAKGWTPDQYNGFWVVVDPGGASEEWARIADTETDALVLETSLAAEPDGLTYTIHAEGTATVSALAEGMPQDWVTAGIQAGHWFSVDGVGVFVQIQSVAAQQLTLATAWAGATLLGVEYSIALSTTSLGLVIASPNQKNLAALLGKLAVDVDGLFATSISRKFAAIDSVAGYQNSWTDEAAPTDPRAVNWIRDHDGWVQMAGRATRASDPAGVQELFTLPDNGVRPPYDMDFFIGNSVDDSGPIPHRGTTIRVTSGGVVQYLEGSWTLLNFAQIRFPTS